MYIGVIEKKEVKVCQIDSDVALETGAEIDGVAVWEWLKTFNVPFDVKIELAEPSYVGAVCPNISVGLVEHLEVIVDGEILGCHSAETGKLFGGEITIPVGVVTKELVLRVYPNMENVGISNIDVLGAHDDGNPMVWPTPKNIEFGNKTLHICEICAANNDVDEVYAAQFLKERLTEKFGDGFFKPDGARVVFKKADYAGERYTAVAKQDEILLSGASRLTMLYAADTLVQVATHDGVPEFNCDDAPEKEMRGFHCGLPTPENFEFMRRFFRYVLLPLRFNVVFIQVSGGMEYKRHPEINEGYASASAKARAGEMPNFPHMDIIAEGTVLSQEQVREYISYARELGLEIVPEVQSLAHVQYITYAHPEIAEIDDTVTTIDDERAADAPPPPIFNHCYCPSLEESYRIIFDIIDEVIEVFEPDRYVHIGHDEVYKIGVCKRCRTKNPSDIFYEHVVRLHDYIAERGLLTTMWADMLHPAPTTAYLTAERRAELPKDILMLDFIWYFHFDKDIEDELLPHGYKVAIGNIYSSHFTRYKSRITKENMIGGQVSTWVGINEQVFAENGKMWDCMYLSEMLWNASKYDERNRTTLSHIIAHRVQPEMRDNLRGVYSVNGYTESEIALPKNKAKLPGAVSVVCPETLKYSGERINVGAKYDRIVFEHATDTVRARIVWRKIPTLGEYIVSYEDGSELLVPVKYANNILCYDYAYGEPLPHGYYRHNGYIGTWLMDPVACGCDYNGKPVNFGAFVWENPNPEKKIVSLSYRGAEGENIGLLIHSIKGCNKK